MVNMDISECELGSMSRDIVQTHSWREDNEPCKIEDLNQIVQEAITPPHRNSRRSYKIWLPLNEDTETKTAWQN